MVVRVGAALARRSVLAQARAPVARQQVRRMGGGHGDVKYEGAEAVVRKYLPENHHIALANIASWFVIYGLYKVSQIGKKPAEAEPTPAAPAAASSGEVPSMFDEGFEDFIKQPGAEDKYVESVEAWAKSA